MTINTFKSLIGMEGVLLRWIIAESLSSSNSVWKSHKLSFFTMHNLTCSCVLLVVFCLFGVYCTFTPILHRNFLRFTPPPSACGPGAVCENDHDSIYTCTCPVGTVRGMYSIFSFHSFFIFYYFTHFLSENFSVSP